MAYHTRPGEGVNSCCGRPWLTVHTRHSLPPAGWRHHADPRPALAAWTAARRPPRRHSDDADEPPTARQSSLIVNDGYMLIESADQQEGGGVGVPAGMV